jgi:mannose-1-phosphate guanylyltransferase
VRSVSVDVGVLERSSRVLVLPGDFGWDDVGTWASLRRVRATDPAGNAVYGVVHTHDASRNVVHAEGGAVVLYGVSDLVVVTLDGLTLVTTLDRSADLKALIESLPSTLRELPA